MKLTIVGIALLVGCERSPSPTPAVLGDAPADRDSYSLGFQLGTSLKNQNTSINLDVYVSGLRDSLAGAPAQVSAAELQSAVKGLRDRAIEAQQGKRRAQADKNRAAGDAFLAANKLHDGVTALPSGVQYRVLTPGAGSHPSNTSTVKVSYRSKLVDGNELASSSGKPITVDLQHVIPGWKEAIPLTKEGATWEIVVPAQLAYGSRGGMGVEPESTLVFEVELLAIADR